jgi:predicted phage baseplate assembly protein
VPESVAAPPPADVVWEFWHRDRAWRELNVIRDETRAFTRSGHVEVAGPGRDAGRGGSGLADGDLFWLRARLRRSAYERSPRLEMVLTNTVPATQAQTALDEVVGGSDGSVGQRFVLANTPVVAEPGEASVQLEIDEGSGFEAWVQVDDFFASGPGDPHFTVNRTTGAIALGDGERGRIPAANPALPRTNVVARRYRFGGGVRGNAGVGTITELQASVADVESVTNRLAALLGSDEEPLAEAKLRAAQELKSKKRAVTTEDFERLARETPGARVRRAKALALTHPRFPDARIPGVVTVIVVPDGDAPNPTPNEATLRAVCAYLDAHRLLTTEVYATAPRYRQVRIEADVVVDPAADLAAVKQAVEERLLGYLHPLRGGPDGEGWEFGANVYFSDVVGRVLAVEGVDRIQDNNLYIWLGPDRFGPCEDVEISADDLVFSTEHEIRVGYEERT